MANNGGAYTWSKTPAANASADSTVNWAEGQVPSSINDSARNLMASLAKYRDDISGSIVTGGTATAYTVTSNQNFDNATDANNQIIAFSPHVANGSNPTLLVDGIGPFPILSAPGLPIPASTLTAGAPVTCIFNNALSAFILQNFYNVNPGGGAVDSTARSNAANALAAASAAQTSANNAQTTANSALALASAAPLFRVGTGSVFNQSSVSVPLSTAFPNNLLGVVATANFFSTVTPVINVSGFTRSGFTALVYTPGTTASFNVGFSYIAWGN